MSELELRYYLKRGVIDFNSIEDEASRQRVNNALALIGIGKYEEAVAVLPPISFEWTWANGEGEPDDCFVKHDDVDLLLTTDNSKIRVGEEDGHLIISASVVFTVHPLSNLDKNDVQNWLDENSMDYAGYISGGWSYLSDDGSGVQVI